MTAPGPAISTPDTTTQALRTGWALMAQQRWADAAAALDQARGQMQADVARRLCGNLLALQTHRPAVYDAIVELMLSGRPQERYQPFQTPSGALALAFQKPDGSFARVTAGPEPVDSAAQVMRQARKIIDADQCLGLFGLGDGYLLGQLAQQPPKLFMSQQHCVFLFEPDIELVLACLKLHDWSAEDGPIAQSRFQWFVGEGWDERFYDAMQGDDYLPLPIASIKQGPSAAQAVERYQAQRQRISDEIAAAEQRIRDCYASLDASHYLDVFSEVPSRPPRVLMLTSKFTTVLQYATRDAAEAFEQMGWQTHMVYEQQDHHRFTSLSFTRLVDRFKPDLVFNLDHLRSEYNDTLPATLPYLCWAQDLLPNLTSVEAGKTVGPRDYVLTTCGPMFTNAWNYPARQIVPTPKLTRVPDRATAAPEQPGPDLVYVSNASRDPRDLADELCKKYKSAGIFSDFVRRITREMIDLYAAGGELPMHWHIGQLVDRLATQIGARWKNPHDRMQLIQQLCHPLNDTLFRQQALRWVADAADVLGLELALHGNGWERHERFARYARGWVSYGQDLQDLTRRAKINLQIIPSFCLHQRMLDGLVAGGFYLVRDTPNNRLAPALASFLIEHAGPDARTVKAVRRRLTGQLRDRFEALLEDAACLTELGVAVDPVEWMWANIDARMLTESDEALPHIRQVSFHDASTLRQRIAHFVNDPEARATVAADQRRDVEQRLSYRAGLTRAIRRITQLIADEAESTSLREAAA